MIWCIDLDNTITSTPDAMKALMEGLQAIGEEVHVVSGHREGPATQEAAQEKKALLEELGCGDCYDQLIVVSGPEKAVPAGKVNYMQHAGASVLVDNSKPNIKAIRKAGFLGLRHVGPKVPHSGT